MQQELTDQQLQAIELLASGEKLGCVAEELDIRRETLWRWRQLPEFQTAMDEQRHIFRHECTERLRGLVSLALSALERDLQAAETSKLYNPVQNALAFLKILQPARLLAEKE